MLYVCKVKNRVMGIRGRIFYRDFGDVESNLIGFCNVVCYCLFIFYELVCGMDGLVYFFFCYVGCRFNYKWMDGFMGKFKVYICIVCVYI